VKEGYWEDMLIRYPFFADRVIGEGFGKISGRSHDFRLTKEHAATNPQSFQTSSLHVYGVVAHLLNY